MNPEQVGLPNLERKQIHTHTPACLSPLPGPMRRCVPSPLRAICVEEASDRVLGTYRVVNRGTL